MASREQANLTEVGGRRMFPEWIDAVRTEGDAATRTHQAVLFALESRRHGTDRADDCLASEELPDTVRIRRRR